MSKKDYLSYFCGYAQLLVKYARLRAELSEALTANERLFKQHSRDNERLFDYEQEITRLRAENERLRESQQCAALEGAETGSPCNTYKMLEAQKDAEIEELRAEVEGLRAVQKAAAIHINLAEERIEELLTDLAAKEE